MNTCKCLGIKEKVHFVINNKFVNLRHQVLDNRIITQLCNGVWVEDTCTIDLCKNYGVTVIGRNSFLEGFEQQLLKNIDSKYNCIIRNSKGNLMVYSKDTDGKVKDITELPFSKFFSFIKVGEYSLEGMLNAHRCSHDLVTGRYSTENAIKLEDNTHLACFAKLIDNKDVILLNCEDCWKIGKDKVYGNDTSN